MIYDLGGIPQIRGDINLNVAAASVPFEPLRFDPTLYKTALDNELEKSKLELDKAELQYKKDVLNQKAEEFWQEENDKLVENLKGYHGEAKTKAVNGEILSPGETIPYYENIFGDYTKRAAEIQQKYTKKDLNRELTKLQYELYSHPEYRNSINAGNYWNNTLQNIQDISLNKKPGFTSKNVNWNKFNFINKSINNGDVLMPDELRITNFLIEDKDEIIKNTIGNSIVLNPTETTRDEFGKVILEKSLEGVSPFDMYKNAYAELSNNKRLVEQIAQDYEYGGNVPSIQILSKVDEYLRNEALSGVNRTLGFNALKPEDLSKDPFKKVIGLTTAGDSLSGKKELNEAKRDTTIEIKEADLKYKIKAQNNDAKNKADLQSQKAADAIQIKEIKQGYDVTGTGGKTPGKSKSSGGSGLTKNQQAKVAIAKRDLEETIGSDFDVFIDDDSAYTAAKLRDIKSYKVGETKNGLTTFTLTDSKGETATVRLKVKDKNPSVLNSPKEHLSINDIQKEVFKNNSSTEDLSEKWGINAKNKKKGKK